MINLRPAVSGDEQGKNILADSTARQRVAYIIDRFTRFSLEIPIWTNLDVNRSAEIVRDFHRHIEVFERIARCGCQRNRDVATIKLAMCRPGINRRGSPRARQPLRLDRTCEQHEQKCVNFRGWLNRYAGSGDFQYDVNCGHDRTVLSDARLCRQQPVTNPIDELLMPDDCNQSKPFPKMLSVTVKLTKRVVSIRPLEALS